MVMTEASRQYLKACVGPSGAPCQPLGRGVCNTGTASLGCCLTNGLDHRKPPVSSANGLKEEGPDEVIQQAQRRCEIVAWGVTSNPRMLTAQLENFWQHMWPLPGP